MSLVNYLGTYETLDQVWEAYPEGGKEGDYLYIASVLKKWNKYTSAWADPTEEDVEGSTIMSLEEDVVVGSSTLINYLGRFETLEDALNAYPEGGNEGDYIYVGDDIYAWDKYANEWVVSSDAPLEVAISEEDIIPNSNTFINYLGGFVDRDAVWQKYPEGGKVGDYLYIASDLHIWDKYICNWVAATPPDESSQIRPIEVLTQEGVVEYSENYINYLGVFESIEQAWEAYPEGGKEGDYIIVGGEQLRWNKYTSNWGEYDPDASTPARPVATIYGDLHVHNDVVIGEDLYARILETFTTKKWVLEQGYISMDDVTSELVMSKIVPDNTTIEVRDGKLVVIGGGGGGTADSVEWDNITGKPSWIGDTKPTYTLDEIAGSNGDGFVTIKSNQTIEGVKNFANGAKFNGALLSYDEEKKAWVFPGNIIASGGITAFGSLSTPVASLFEALPIDGTTIKRDPVTNELYVDTNVVGGSGGGITIEEVENFLTLNNYATQEWVNNQGYATTTDFNKFVKDFVTLDTTQTISGIKDFTNGLKVGGLSVYKSQADTIYLDANLVVRGGVTAFGTNKTITASIFDSLPIDGATLKRTENGVLYVDTTVVGGTGGGSLDEEQLEEYLKPYAKTADVANTYATKSSVNALSTQLNDFLSGSDTDTIINKWSELAAFLAGLAETDDLATILSGKANKATTLAGYGITDAYTKAEINTTVSGLNTSIANLRTYANDTFVELATPEKITARHNFIDGLKINGLPIYNSQDDVVYIDANLVVRGGVTAWGTNEETAPNIFEGLPIDGTSIYWDNGVLKSSATSSGGINEEQLEEYLRPYATQSWVTGKGYLTGITGTMVTNALGYTPVEKNEALTTADNNAVGYGYSSGGWGDFGPTIVFGSGSYRAALQSSGSNTNLRYGYTVGTNSFTWKTIAFTSDIPTSLKNPNALSWSGYSSGSYDGSSAKSITIPNNTNQLTNGAGFITATASITGNAATATKLKNSVSLWGRSFDGTADLTGSLNVTTGEGYRINYNGYDLRFIVSGSSSNRGIWDNTNNNWLMYRSGSNDIYFTSGNIGFGTTSPTEKVTVGGNINLSGAYKYKIQGNDVVSIYSTNYYLADSAIELGYNTFIVGRKINFQTSATTTKVTTATLDESGNFSVKGVMKLPLTATNAFSGAQLLFADGVGRIGVNTNNMMAFYADAFRLRPASTSSAASSIGVLIDKDSNLSTTGDLQASGVLRLPVIDSGFANPRIVFGDSIIRIGATTAGLLGVYASGDIRINPNSASSANNTMGLWLKASGFNGINITNPTQALHVNGKGIFADTTNPWISLQRDGVNWYLQVVSTGLKLGRTSALGVLVDDSGNMVAPGGVTATNSSDERLKRNIRKFNAREVLMSLGGVWEYEYIDSEVQKNHIYEGTHFGLIYQHVKGTKLDVMCLEREDGFGTLNYLHPKFISLIAGATMENISEVEKLRREIRHLKNKVKQLESRA